MPIMTTRPVRDGIRKFNKHVLNPAMLLLAGRKHWYAAVIRHTGRRSGRRYATPVVAERVADGIIIPLPYGASVDWLRNARSAGTATITVDGQSFGVVDPQLIDARMAGPQLSSRRRRGFERLGIDEFVKFSFTADRTGQGHGN
jgi:hypothetical protein